MTLIGFRARNHPQQTGDGRTDLDVDDRATTPEIFAPLYERYRFTVDVAASADNAKLPRFYDRSVDGLSQSWAGERVWCNPPYSSIRPWVEKAWREIGADIIVMLLPANRTEQSWWQELIEPYRDRADGLSVNFLPGRIRFAAPGRDRIGPNERPPFGCVLVVWEGIRSCPDIQGVLL